MSGVLHLEICYNGLSVFDCCIVLVVVLCKVVLILKSVCDYVN